MDREWWYRFVFAVGIEHAAFIDTPLATFRLHESSKTQSDYSLFQRDTATVLHAICMQVGLETEAEILAKGYDLLPEYEWPIHVPVHMIEEVQYATAFFLLRWNYRLYTQRQFDLMQEAMDVLALDQIDWPPKLASALASMKKKLRFPSYQWLRGQRKLAQLTQRFKS